MARPSIVPIALTLDDRTGYTLWAPPWEEDGEEWQAFLGATEDDTARVHLFPTPAALAAFCRTATDHDLADHPVWPVVAGLGAPDLTPDDEHRYDLDGVYDLAAEGPDRWTVEELATTVDMVGRLAECLDTSDEDDDENQDDEDDDSDDDGSGGGRSARSVAGRGVAADPDDDSDDDDEQFEAVAELVARPEIGSLGLGAEAFAGRSGENAWAGVGRALDELWEDVVEEIAEHLDWTGAGTARPEDYPSASEEDDDEPDDDEPDDIEDLDDSDQEIDTDDDDAEPAVGPASARTPGRRLPARSTAAAPGDAATPEVSTIRGNSRLSPTPAAVAAAAAFWESVGILPVELVVPDGAGLTLRCYVEDEARFLGRDGEIFLFDSPADLARFCAGRERHDLVDIASWPEVADTDTLPMPGDEDRYDLTELSEVLTEVSDGAAGLVDHRAFAHPIEGVRDIAEYANLTRVDELLAPGTALGRELARGEREPDAPLPAEDAPTLRREWDDVVAAVSSALVFRD